MAAIPMSRCWVSDLPSEAAGSERNVVVELLAARSAAGRLLGIGGSARAPGTGRHRRGTRATGGTGATASTEHLQIVADDLGRVAFVALLVLPLARSQASLDVHLRSLTQVLSGDLGQSAKKRYPVPLGPLLLLAGLLVAPALARRHAQVSHGRTGGHGARLRVRAEITDENDLVDATRHGASPRALG